ncbi:MAG: ferritin [bacterium]|nr:ferritin [bacterium]
MLTNKMEEALNNQLNAEFYSSYLYLSMSAYCSNLNMNGAANWMKMQSEEEHMHAMKIFDFIIDRDGKVNLKMINKPETEWKSITDVFENVQKHEALVTKSINDLVDKAIHEKDHAVTTFLQWFVTEQVEEEATVKTIVDKLKLVGDNSVALFMIDGELAQRPAPAPIQ